MHFLIKCTSREQFLGIASLLSTNYVEANWRSAWEYGYAGTDPAYIHVNTEDCMDWGHDNLSYYRTKYGLLDTLPYADGVVRLRREWLKKDADTAPEAITCPTDTEALLLL